MVLRLCALCMFVLWRACVNTSECLRLVSTRSAVCCVLLVQDREAEQDAFIDMTSLKEAYSVCLAGACFGMGFAFAGTAHDDARRVLLSAACATASLTTARTRLVRLLCSGVLDGRSLLPAPRCPP